MLRKFFPGLDPGKLTYSNFWAAMKDMMKMQEKDRRANMTPQEIMLEEAQKQLKKMAQDNGDEIEFDDSKKSLMDSFGKMSKSKPKSPVALDPARKIARPINANRMCAEPALLKVKGKSPSYK